MSEQQKNWRCGDSQRPINEEQAELWRQQTLQASYVPKPEKGTASEKTDVRNPWLENMQGRRPRRRNKGIVVFALLLAVLVIPVGIYLAVCGIPEQGNKNLPGIQQIVKENKEITIPLIDAGDTRLAIQTEHGEELSIQEIYKKVNPTVVTVMAMRGEGMAAIGTGVIFTQDGYFLTNAHVIEGSAACRIILADGRQFSASLVGYDQKRDVAVLKAMYAYDLPAAELGDSRQLEVGDPVYAIGNPLGMELRGTLTDGIVSAINRDVDVDGYTMTLIQTNAALNEGNSGGPLINRYGQVIGINVIKMTAGIGEAGVEGLGFAIPTETVEYLANQILEYGKPLPDTSLGIMVYAYVSEENALQGLMVDSVSEGSCAELGGVLAGDIILEADGVKVIETSDLLAVRRSHAPGEEMTLTVLRGEEKIEIVVVLDEAV